MQGASLAAAPPRCGASWPLFVAGRCSGWPAPLIYHSIAHCLSVYQLPARPHPAATLLGLTPFLQAFLLRTALPSFPLTPPLPSGCPPPPFLPHTLCSCLAWHKIMPLVHPDTALLCPTPFLRCSLSTRYICLHGNITVPTPFHWFSRLP